MPLSRGTVKELFRLLVPFAVGVAAVVAMLAGFLWTLSRMNEQTMVLSEERILEIAVGIPELLESVPGALETEPIAAGRRLGLSSALERLLGIDSFERYVFAPGDPPAALTADTLAVSALELGQYEMGSSPGSRTVSLVYPREPEQGMSVVDRIVISDPVPRMLERYRYDHLLLTAAVLMLLVIPSLIISLSGLHRRYREWTFTGTTPAGGRPKTGGGKPEPSRSPAFPAELLDAPGDAALLLLDESGCVMEASRAAVELLDVPRGDLVGLSPSDMSFIEGELPDAMPAAGEERRLGLNVLRGDGESIRVQAILSGLTDGSCGLRLMSPGGDVPSVCAGDGHAAVGETSVALAVETAARGLRDTATRESDAERFSEILRALGRRPEDVRLESEEARSGDLTDLGAELTAAVSALSGVLPERVGMELDVPPGLPSVRCERHALTRLVKHLVFHSMETVSGQLRLRLATRDVPSPGSHATVPHALGLEHSRLVELTYTDGSRVPVRLKEALTDPETDSEGITRDFGSHVSAAARVLTEMGLVPVFTEEPDGTRMHLFMETDEAGLYSGSGDSARGDPGLAGMSLLLCDSSTELMRGMTDALTLMGLEVRTAPDWQTMEERARELRADFLVIDASVLPGGGKEEGSPLRLPEGLGGGAVVLTAGSTDRSAGYLERRIIGATVLRKPYSPEELVEQLSRTDGDDGSGDAISAGPL